MRALATILALTWFVAACNDDEKVFKGGGSNENKPATTLLNGTEGLDGLGATQNAPTESAHVTYELTVTSNSKAQLCTGDVKLVIMSDFTMKFPDSKAQCVSLTVDLSKALGGAGGGVGSQDKNNASSDGKVLSFKSIAGAEFDPPRPFLLGPVIQDESIYKDFKRTVETTVKSVNAAGSPATASGKFNITVDSVHSNYKDPKYKMDFEDVLQWRMEAEGFDGVQASSGLLFKKMEWVWNVKPIMIPHVTIVGNLADLIKSSDPGGSADIVGEITIDLRVKEFDFTGGGG